MTIKGIFIHENGVFRQPWHSLWPLALLVVIVFECIAAIARRLGWGD